MFNFYRQPTSGRVCLGGPASSWARCYIPASYGRRGPLGRRERVRAIHRTAGTECIAFIRELRADDGRTLARGVNSPTRDPMFEHRKLVSWLHKPEKWSAHVVRSHDRTVTVASDVEG